MHPVVRLNQQGQVVGFLMFASANAAHHWVRRNWSDGWRRAPQWNGAAYHYSKANGWNLEL